MYRIYGDNDVATERFNLFTIYDPDQFVDGYIASNMSMTKSLSKTGNFSFTLPPNNPAWGDITPLQTTIIVVWDDGTEKCIWYGRVIGASHDLYKNLQVKCEDALAFLSDILIRPFKYRAGVNVAGSTIDNHLITVLAMYNSRCSKKRLFGNNIIISTPEEFHTTDTYAVKGVESFVTVWDEITGMIAYGDRVYITLDYTGISGGASIPTLIIASMPYANADPNYPIEATVNLVSYSSEADYTELYTSLIPLDDNNDTLPGNNYRIDSSLATQYGVIEKTLALGCLDNEGLVRTFCYNVMESNARRIIPKLSIGALDLFYTGDTSVAIEPGLAVRIKSPPHGIDALYLCTESSVDLENPENATYSFEYYRSVT